MDTVDVSCAALPKCQEDEDTTAIKIKWAIAFTIFTIFNALSMLIGSCPWQSWQRRRHGCGHGRREVFDCLPGL